MMGHQHKRGIARTQTALLPPAIEDYVGARSAVRVIERYVSGLDLAGLGFAKSMPAATGRPGYAPDDLLGLYLYGYWNRVRSSRRLEVECQRNLEVMWLMGQLAPDHKTIADFRRVNAAAFQSACGQFVQFLREAKLVGMEAPVVAVDGSKFKACASKKSLVDLEQTAKERKKIERRIAEYLEEMDEADRVEDGEVQPTGEQIEAALERLRKRDKKLEQAQVELAARAEESEGKDKTVRVGLTDPDCVMLKQNGGGALAGYNVQQAVDAKHKLIVAHEVTTRGNDHTSLEPTASQAQAALKAESMTAVADCGFMNGAQAQACEDQGITPVVPMPQVSNTQGGDFYAKTMFVYDQQSDTYRCPAGQVLSRYKRDEVAQTDYYRTRACAQCALKAKCTKSKEGRSIARSWFADAAERAHERARHNPRLMRVRSATVEHPFGNLKAMMQGGFSLRTLPKVKGEMALAVLTYNLKRALNILGIDKLISKLGMGAALSSA
jgi:transposase